VCNVVGMSTLPVCVCNVVGMSTVSEGNLTDDRICTCDLESGYYSVEGVHYNPDFCVHKHCSNGSVLVSNGMCYSYTCRLVSTLCIVSCNVTDSFCETNFLSRLSS